MPCPPCSSNNTSSCWRHGPISFPVTDSAMPIAYFPSLKLDHIINSFPVFVRYTKHPSVTYDLVPSLCRLPVPHFALDALKRRIEVPTAADRSSVSSTNSIVPSTTSTHSRQ